MLVALVLTLSRNAWVGACAGIGTLFLLRDLRSVFRLAALLPVALGLLIAFAPAAISDRFSSALSLKDAYGDSATSTSTVQSNRDRIAMIKSGIRIIKDNPLTGVGPDMVIQVYPGYREPTAVSQRNSHLHNVPLQIAAERGLPALAIWCWFVGDAARRLPAAAQDVARCRRSRRRGIACVVAMLAAGHVRIQFRRLRVPDAVSRASSRCHTPPSAFRHQPSNGRPRECLRRLPGLDQLLDRIAGRSILVIGDLMVDQFVIGTVDRISPEAPVPIVRFDHETWRLGGAANVANNIVALGGRVDAIGVVGERSPTERGCSTISPGARSARQASSAMRHAARPVSCAS